MKPLVLLLFVISFWNLSGQIPQNFEYMYHDNQFSEFGATHVIDEGILFVSHNGYKDMTVVALAKNDNTQEVLFTSEFSSNSKIVITQDSAIHFLLYNLFYYDVGMSGFYDIVYTDNEVQVNSFQYGDGSPISEKTISHVTIDTTGNYILGTYNDEFIIFDGTDILEEKEVDPIEELYLSTNGYIYFYSRNKVFKYFQGEINQIFSTNRIADLGKLGPYSAILIREGFLYLFDDNDALTNFFEVNEKIYTLDEIGLIDSMLYTMTQSDSILTVSRFNWEGELSSESEVLLNKNEVITAIDYLSDDNFLLKGRYGMSIFNNYPRISSAFFRNVDIENGNSYEKTDVQILDFELFQTGKDSFVNQIFEATNDTIWWVSYLYDINCTLQNNTDDTISFASIYHSLIFNNPGPTSLKLYELDTLLNADESLPVIISGESFGGRQVLVDLELFLPGANHRFNLNENIISLPDFKSDVSTLEVDNTLNVYPNPTTNYLNIDSDANINSVAVYNIQGQLVLAQSGKNQIDKIDVSQLESGTYFLKTGSSITKFIKQ